MHLVDHVDLEAAQHRLVDGLIEKLRYLVDAPVRRGVEFHVIDETAGVDVAAGIAHPARVGGDVARAVDPGAIERLGQDARDRRLAHPARPGEQVGVVQPALRQRVRQRLNHMLLAHQCIKVGRPVFSGENDIGHGLILRVGSQLGGMLTLAA